MDILDFFNSTIANIVIALAAILSLVISLASAIQLYSQNRRNIRIQYVENYKKEYVQGSDLIVAYMIIENLSRMPISITRMQLTIDSTLYDTLEESFPLSNCKIIRKGEVTFESIISTAQLPIYLESFGCSHANLAFPIPQDMQLSLEKPLTFRICTSRGRAIQKTFSPHEVYQIHRLPKLPTR